MTTTAQAFQKFLEEEVEPTDWQIEARIPSRKKSVKENLTEKFPASSDMPFHKARLMGSAAKG